MKQGFIYDYKGIQQQHIFIVKGLDNTEHSQEESNHYPYSRTSTSGNDG